MTSYIAVQITKAHQVISGELVEITTFEAPVRNSLIRDNHKYDH